MKKQFENENNFKYDWVMLYRFDHIFLVNLNFSEFDNQYIYFRHTNGLRAPQQYSHGYPGREECRCYHKKGGYGVRLQDVFTFSSSENMDKFASVYEHHEASEEPFMDPHDECYVQLKRVGLEDNLYLKKGVLASNAQLVEKAVCIVEDIGAKIMTPAETREKLKLVKHF